MAENNVVEEVEEIEVVQIKLDDYNKMRARLDELEKKEKGSTPAPVGGNNMGLSVPPYMYNRPTVQKKSGWETFGKMALGGAITLICVGIGSALGGIGNSEFGGD